MIFLLGMRSDGMNTRHNNKTNDIPNSTKTLDLFIFVGVLLPRKGKKVYLRWNSGNVYNRGAKTLFNL